MASSHDLVEADQPAPGSAAASFFTILVPVRDGAGFLAGAVESALAQTDPDWELVIGDNASGDATATIALGFADPRIRHHRWDDPAEIFDNFERTFRLARGSWVFLLPADDRLAPTCLARIRAAIAEHRGPRALAAVVTRAARIDPIGRSIDVAYYGIQGIAPVPGGTYDAAGWLAAACTPGSQPWDAGAYRRTVVEALGSFFRADIPSMSSDTELLLRLATVGDVAYLDEPLKAVTGSTGSHTPGRLRRNLEQAEPFTPQGIALAEGLRAHERVRVVSPSERRVVAAAIARTHLRRATAHRTANGGRGRRAALADVARAARLSPTTVTRRLSMVAAIVLLPTAPLARLRERELRRREQRSLDA
jgi:hypothetical protein